MALNATTEPEPMFSKQMTEMRTTLSQTDRTGMRCFGCNCVKYAGRPPSRAQAQDKRETEEMVVMLPLRPRRTKQQMMTVVAACDPVVLSRIVAKGFAEPRTVSTSPIYVSMRAAMITPRVPLMPMDQTMALGTADLALRVSSLMWMTPSTPGNSIGLVKSSILVERRGSRMHLPVMLKIQVNMPSCHATKGLESHPEKVMDSSKKLASCFEYVSWHLVGGMRT